MKRYLLAFFIVFVILFSSCAKQQPMINGVSFVASRQEVTQEHIDPVIEVNANYAAVMPFGFIRDINTPTIIHNTQRQWFGETRAGAAQYIQHLKANNIGVMVKPQIWIRRGEFTGYLKMDSEAAWKELEDSYTSFIMEYAHMAAETGAELFCIGTELEQFIVNRPQYWHDLIVKIKEVYKGKLTYAANWDEYKRVPFWKALDFIGVDAYFPVSESKTPTVEEAKSGWEPWKRELRGVSMREGRPILFTEFGYRSTDFAGKEPWNSDYTIESVNIEAQTNTTQAVFESVWNQPWFAGGFVWKWFIDHHRVGGEADNMFTPQNKPAETVLKNYFSQAQLKSFN